MRNFFNTIFIITLAFVGLPALGLAIMHDGTGAENMPVHLYTDDADAERMLYAELSSSISDVEDGTTTNMVYELHQDIINTAIFELFRSDDFNPEYMPDENCVEDSCKYVYSDEIEIGGSNFDVRVMGAWVDFKDDVFIVNVYLEIGINDGLSYETVAKAFFDFHDYPDRYELKFDKIELGNLPLPISIITRAINMLDENISTFDLDEQSDVLPIGDLDISNMSLTIVKDDILDNLEDTEGGNDETGYALAKEVLSIIYDHELVEFKLNDEEFVLTAGISKFRSDETDVPLYFDDFHIKTIIEGEEVIGEFNPNSFNPDNYLTDMFTEYVFNSALSGGGFKIYEETFNKLLYYKADGFSDTRTTYEYYNDEGELEVINLGLKAIWFEFDPEEIYVYALFEIAGIDSVLKITAENVSISDTELIFEFTTITFGEDEGELDGDFLLIDDLEVFNQMFLELGDVEFGEFVDMNGDVVLKITAERLSDLMQDGSQVGAVEVTGIHLYEHYIELDVEPADTTLAAAFDAFTDALNDAFVSGDLLNDLAGELDIDNPGPEQDVYNDVQDLQNAIINEEPISADDITDLFDDFEQMDQESQEAFLNTFNDLIPPGVYDQFTELFESENGSGE